MCFMILEFISHFSMRVNIVNMLYDPGHWSAIDKVGTICLILNNICSLMFDK